MFSKDISEVLITKEELERKVKELGKQISDDYKDSDALIAIGILKGSVVFLADLIRSIDLHTELEFMAVSSYGASTKSSGVVKINKDLDIDIYNKDVIIIEDIIDSGITLHYLTELLKKRKPKSLKICTLLNKPDRRKADVNVDYIGFEIPDKFVVGYGLDYASRYRNLPYVGVLKKEIYE